MMRAAKEQVTPAGKGMSLQIVEGKRNQRSTLLGTEGAQVSRRRSLGDSVRRARAKSRAQHDQSPFAADFQWAAFWKELFLLTLSPFTILVVWAIYGWHTVKAKHMVPSQEAPLIFNAVFITEVWCAPIMLILTLSFRLHVLYYEAMVMFFVLLFRHTITAVRYGYMHKRLRRTIYHSRNRAEVEKIHNDTQLITAWLAVEPNRIPVLVRAAAWSCNVDIERPVSCRDSMHKETSRSSTGRMIERLIERMLSRGDSWYGTKHMDGTNSTGRPLLFNFTLTLTLISWLYALAMSVIIPLWSRYRVYGSLSTFWEAEVEHSPGGGALVCTLWAMCFAVTTWESVVLFFIMFTACIDMQRMTVLMELLYDAARAGMQVRADGGSGRFANRMFPITKYHPTEEECAEYDANPIVVDLTIGNNAAAWLGMRRILLHLGRHFRKRTSCYLLMMLGLSVYLITFMLSYFMGDNMQGVVSPLDEQRMLYVQYITAVVCFVVTAFMTIVIVWGEKANSSDLHHKKLLTEQQLYARQMAREQYNNGKTAWSREYDHSDDIIASVLSILELEREVEPIEVFGLPVGTWMLRGAILAFISTSAIVIRALTFNPPKLNQ